MSYPGIIKEAALEKLFLTDLSLRHHADELGIPRATLYGWKRQYKMIENDRLLQNLTTSVSETCTTNNKFPTIQS